MKKLIFLDTETTGNEVNKDRLIELAYKTPEETVVEYFKPPVPISVKSMSITHITEEMVADKPAFADSVVAKKLQALLNDGVMVAHNALFDKAMLEADGLSVSCFIDTLRLARFLDSENALSEYNLQFLRYALKLEVVVDGLQAHSAKADIAVLEALFKRQFTKIRKTVPTDDEAIEKMIEISTTPILIKVFPFGKHKGKTLSEVAQNDQKYLEWLLNEKLNEASQTGIDPDQDDWIYTLRKTLELSD